MSRRSKSSEYLDPLGSLPTAVGLSRCRTLTLSDVLISTTRCTATADCHEKWFFKQVAAPARPTTHMQVCHPTVKLPAKHYVQHVYGTIVREGTPQSQVNAIVAGYYDRLSPEDKEALKYSRSNHPFAKKVQTSSKKPAAKRQRKDPNAKHCEICDKSSKTHYVFPTECCGALMCQGPREEGADYPMFDDHDSCAHYHEEQSICHMHMAEGHEGAKWEDCKECRYYFGMEVEEYMERATCQWNVEPLGSSQVAPTKYVKCLGKCGRDHEVWADASEEEIPQFICRPCSYGAHVIRL